MATMTLEELLRRTSDEDLLAVHAELASCVVPATGAAHAFVRKVNKMIDDGDLCIRADSYRKVYLPTLAKVVLKEMANRYADYCYYRKALDDDTGVAECSWCRETFDKSELHNTDIGVLCDQCLEAIRSRGEKVTVHD